MQKYYKWICLSLIIVAYCFLISSKNNTEINQPSVQVSPLPELPSLPKITNSFPGYQEYDKIISQLKEWEKEAPDFVEIGIYGKSTKNKELWYICITNEKSKFKKLTTLVTAGIHGNEPLSVSTTMAYIGTILSEYEKNSKVAKLVNTRKLYFVPCVSPDSYPNSRGVDGVDPNRNFPTLKDPNRKSVPPVQALREFFLKIKPYAVASGHTYGRMYLYPWGDQTNLPPHHEDYQRIVGQMGKLSNYRVIRGCEIYNRPIYGTGHDWYYRNGAFAIVIEFGTHQRIPSMSDTKTEFERTFKSILYFLEHAPEVQPQMP